MNWRVKGLIQKVLGFVPGGERLHYVLQRKLGGMKNFKAELESKVDDWRLMVGYLRDRDVSLRGARVLEVGSGWYPTFPWCCYLAGVERVTTVDLNRHLKEDLTRRSFECLEPHLGVVAEATGTPLVDVEGRYRRAAQRVAAGHGIAAADGAIEYRAPADARRTGLADHSIDLVLSNSVLEHVPEEVVADMFAEARRILAKGGLMYHGVNCGDHYAYVDQSITQLNYLRYSDASWTVWNNAFLYQNRLRAHEFLALAEKAGFEVIFTTARPSERRLRELRAIDVDARFAQFSPEQLCITSNDFLARVRESLTARENAPTLGAWRAWRAWRTTWLSGGGGARSAAGGWRRRA